MRVAGLDLVGPRPVSGGDICDAFAACLEDGTPVFAKTLPHPPQGLFAAEARGLAALRVEGGPPVPAVKASGSDGLVLDFIPPGPPSDDAARRFGEQLARLHGCGGGRFGAEAAGYVGTLPIENGWAESWPQFFGQRRLASALAAAGERGAVAEADAAAVREVITNLADLAGPAEPPARIHGDLWAGNLLWAADGQVWLIDAAAACDGHRETDLAMLALFGAPFEQEIRAAYQRVHPLADGWQDRVPLHQLHPLLIHAALFRGGYGARAGAAARRLLH